MNTSLLSKLIKLADGGIPGARTDTADVQNIGQIMQPVRQTSDELGLTDLVSTMRDRAASALLAAHDLNALPHIRRLTSNITKAENLVDIIDAVRYSVGDKASKEIFEPLLPELRKKFYHPDMLNDPAFKKEDGSIDEDKLYRAVRGPIPVEAATAYSYLTGAPITDAREISEDQGYIPKTRGTYALPPVGIPIEVQPTSRYSHGRRHRTTSNRQAYIDGLASDIADPMEEPDLGLIRTDDMHRYMEPTDRVMEPGVVGSLSDPAGGGQRDLGYNRRRFEQRFGKGFGGLGPNWRVDDIVEAGGDGLDAVARRRAQDPYGRIDTRRLRARDPLFPGYTPEVPQYATGDEFSLFSSGGPLNPYYIRGIEEAKKQVRENMKRDAVDAVSAAVGVYNPLLGLAVPYVIPEGYGGRGGFLDSPGGMASAGAMGALAADYGLRRVGFGPMGRALGGVGLGGAAMAGADYMLNNSERLRMVRDGLRAGGEIYDIMGDMGDANQLYDYVTDPLTIAQDIKEVSDKGSNDQVYRLAKELGYQFTPEEEKSILSQLDTQLDPRGNLRVPAPNLSRFDDYGSTAVTRGQIRGGIPELDALRARLAPLLNAKLLDPNAGSIPKRLAQDVLTQAERYIDDNRNVPGAIPEGLIQIRDMTAKAKRIYDTLPKTPEEIDKLTPEQVSQLYTQVTGKEPPEGVVQQSMNLAQQVAVQQSAEARRRLLEFQESVVGPQKEELKGIQQKARTNLNDLRQYAVDYAEATGVPARGVLSFLDDIEPMEEGTRLNDRGVMDVASDLVEEVPSVAPLVAEKVIQGAVGLAGASPRLQRGLGLGLPITRRALFNNEILTDSQDPRSPMPGMARRLRLGTDFKHYFLEGEGKEGPSGAVRLRENLERMRRLRERLPQYDPRSDDTVYTRLGNNTALQAAAGYARDAAGRAIDRGVDAADRGIQEGVDTAMEQARALSESVRKRVRETLRGKPKPQFSPENFLPENIPKGFDTLPSSNPVLPQPGQPEFEDVVPIPSSNPVLPRPRQPVGPKPVQQIKQVGTVAGPKPPGSSGVGQLLSNKGRQKLDAMK